MLDTPREAAGPGAGGGAGVGGGAGGGALDSVHRTLHLTARGMAMIAGAAVVVLMLMTVVDVTMRLLGLQTFRGVIELSEIVLVVVVFAGMMSAEATRTHVRTSIVTDRLPGRVRQAARLLGRLVAVAFVAWMTWATWEQGLAAMAAGEESMTGLPVWVAKMFVPIGFFALLLEYLASTAAGAIDLVRGTEEDRAGFVPDFG